MLLSNLLGVRGQRAHARSGREVVLYVREDRMDPVAAEVGLGRFDRRIGERVVHLRVGSGERGSWLPDQPLGERNHLLGRRHVGGEQGVVVQRVDGRRAGRASRERVPVPLSYLGRRAGGRGEQRRERRKRQVHVVLGDQGAVVVPVDLRV